MLQRLKVTSYALLILLLLVLPSQADEYCTTAQTCAAAAQAAGKMLGNQGKNGISGYPFVLGTNTYGCWYYPDSHANKNYAGSAFWGAASSEAQMRDPDPGAAYHVRLKCGGGGPAPIAKRVPLQAKPVPQQRRATQHTGGYKVYKSEKRLAPPVAVARKQKQLTSHMQCTVAARDVCLSKMSEDQKKILALVQHCIKEAQKSCKFDVKRNTWKSCIFNVPLGISPNYRRSTKVMGECAR